MPLIKNFGRNVQFTPAQLYEPRNDEEVLEILRQHRGGKIRCIGSGHSWSGILVTGGVLLDLRHFDAVDVAERRPEPLVRLGAGCTIGRALKLLKAQGLTLPTVGAIKEQTIAGAISTGTHGSGAPSLSHFVEEMRIATFDPGTGDPAIIRLRGRSSLLAARCSLGFFGVVLDVMLRAVAAYRVKERFEKATLQEILGGAGEWPLQQFVLIPWKWRYMVYRRQTTDERETWVHVALMRLQLLLLMDALQHWLLKFVLLRVPRIARPGLIRFFFRRLLCLPAHRRVDDSDRVLTLRHDLFRHVEMEVFIPERELEAADRSIRRLLKLAAGKARARTAKPRGHFPGLRGCWTHHYPISFRYVRPDETLVSMASSDGRGKEQTWIAISFFTYLPIDAAFRTFAAAVAKWLVKRHGARLHWGKYFPIPFREAVKSYRHFADFEVICRRYDPAGVFWNENL